MKYLKSYETFENKLLFLDDAAERLIKLITDNGDVIDKNGRADEGIGIIDDDGYYIDYIAGVDKDGLIHANSVNMYNYVFNKNDGLMNICIDYKYEGQKKFYPLGSYEGQKQLIENHPERIKDIEKNFEKINPQIRKEFKDIFKQIDWS